MKIPERNALLCSSKQAYGFSATLTRFRTPDLIVAVL